MRFEDKTVFDEILFELLRAEKKFPNWPRDPVHGVAIMMEEAGEAIQAAIDFYYKREETPEKLRKELLQTAAMATRMIIFVDKHKLKQEKSNDQIEHISF